MPLSAQAQPASPGVVSTSHPLATEAGLSVLRAGGNAIDAAAAVQFALNVVEPQSSGIGGGAFILIYLAKTHQVYAIDAREMAPLHSTADELIDHDFDHNSTSGLSVAVPGTLAGFNEALTRWGKLTLGQVLQPAIHLARDGFSVTSYLAKSLQSPRLVQYPEAKKRFYGEQGQPLEVGDRLIQPELANTFSILANQGVSAFYQGEIARAIIKTQRRSSMGPAGWGRMTLEDLAHYQIHLREPLVFDYHGYHLVGMPPPSSGASTLFEVLGLLDHYSQQQRWHESLYRAHLSMQALTLAFQDRARALGDPNQMQVQVEQLLQPVFLQQRQQLLTEGVLPHTINEVDPGGMNTTHFSIVDQEGNVVTCTSTIEELWGSGLWVPEYGFFLNNEMTDFDQQPMLQDGTPSPNRVQGGLRPRSSMSPILVFRHGKWLMAYGSPGGPTIISTLLEVTQDWLDLQHSPQEAIDQPRYAVMNGAGVVWVEKTFPKELTANLLSLGHDIQLNPDNQGSVQAVGIDEKNQRYWGAADLRRDAAVGYQ